MLASLDRHVEAKARCERSLEIVLEIGDRHGQALALAELGATLGALGDLAGAAAALIEAVALARELAIPGIELVATARLAGLPDLPVESAVAGALAALAAHEKRAGPALAMEARFRLWQATGNPAHLAEARCRLDFLVEHAPPDCRESLMSNVPLNRDVIEASGTATAE